MKLILILAAFAANFASAATDANTTSAQIVSESSVQTPAGFLPFIAIGAGYTGYDKQLDVEGVPSSAKLLGSYYFTQTPVVLDLGVGVLNQRFSQTAVSERSVTSTALEAAARYQFANRIQAGLIANTLFDKGAAFGANQGDAQFAGLQALKEFNVAKKYVARVGGRLMTDLNVNDRTVNMGLIDLQLGYNPRSATQTLATKSAAKTPEFVPQSALKSISSNDLFASNVLLFPSNSDLIAANDLQQINKLVAALKKSGVQSIDVIGHADTTGQVGYNKLLSLKRAQQVKTALVAAGLDKVQINTIAKGSEQALSSKEQSRRVELIINGVADDTVLKNMVQ